MQIKIKIIKNSFITRLLQRFAFSYCNMSKHLPRGKCTSRATKSGKKKRALVIGGAGGIGRAIVRQLVDLNIEVVCLTRNTASLQQFEIDFPDVTVYINDIIDWNTTEAIVKKLERFDYVANAAGVDQFNDLVDVTEEIYNKVMSVNVDAAFNICRTVADVVVKRLELRTLLNSRAFNDNTPKDISLSIVNVSSVASFKAYRSVSCVCVSKGSLDQMTRSFAIEYGKHNIRMNNVNPATVTTKKAEDIWKKIAVRDNKTVEDLKKEHLAKIPLGRFVETSHVADAVIFLLSPFSKMITGATLIVDGGLSATTY